MGPYPVTVGGEGSRAPRPEGVIHRCVFYPKKLLHHLGKLSAGGILRHDGLDGLDVYFDSLDRMETKRSKCCDGRLRSTHALPIAVDSVLLFQMTQTAGGIVVHC